MNRTWLTALAAAAIAAPLAAQNSVPEISYDAVANLLKLPDGVYMGEAAGVASTARGRVLVYTRTGGSTITIGTSRAFSRGSARLFEFESSGKFVREIGQGMYGFNFAQAVHVDPQDNIWVVDQGSSQVIKFANDGRFLTVFGRKPEALRVPGAPAAAPAGGGFGPRPPGAEAPAGAAPAGSGAAPAGAPRPAPAPGAAAGGPPAGGGGQGAGARSPGSGTPGDSFVRPSDIALDAQGNLYVADGLGANARVAKFDRNGKYLKSWGSRGAGSGQFNTVSSIAVDAQNNVYVADRGNKRIQVFDAEGTFKSQIENIGSPWAICITPGAHQYLYSSNSNDPSGFENGEIYKLELDGRPIGKFGKAGKLPKQFGTINQIDCRNENDLWVAELTNWRVQKLTLKK